MANTLQPIQRSRRRGIVARLRRWADRNRALDHRELRQLLDREAMAAIDRVAGKSRTISDAERLERQRGSYRLAAHEQITSEMLTTVAANAHLRLSRAIDWPEEVRQDYADGLARAFRKNASLMYATRMNDPDDGLRVAAEVLGPEAAAAIWHDVADRVADTMFVQLAPDGCKPPFGSDFNIVGRRGRKGEQ